MLLIVSVAVPLLVNVTGLAALVVPTVWLPKLRLVGDSVTAGALATAPVPVRLTVCGLPGALSVIVTVPVRVPVAVGVKVTLMVQLALAAKEVPQVLLCA